MQSWCVLTEKWNISLLELITETQYLRFLLATPEQTATELPCSTALSASNNTLFLTWVSVMQSKCVCVTKRKVMNTLRQSVHLISCPSTSVFTVNSVNVLFVAVSTTDFQRQLLNRTCTTLSNGSIKMNKELERTKNVVVTHFRTLLQHLPWTLIRKVVHSKRPRGRSVKVATSELRSGNAYPFSLL
jgi:hypothetical protein